MACAAPYDEYLKEPLRCDDGVTHWHRFVTLSIEVWKSYGDVKYWLPERRVNDAITNIQEKIPIKSVPVEMYIKLYDALFPSYSFSNANPDDPRFDLFMQVVNFGHQVPRQVELYYLPWLMQQTNLNAIKPEDLPLENFINANVSKRIYILQFSWYSFYIFYACVGYNLVWCLGVSVYVLRYPRISLSSLSDVDLIDSISNHPDQWDSPLGQRFRHMSSLNTEEIAANVKDIIIRVNLHIDGSNA